jgi:murein DD-endopeptidase MepM/ murein hydrolase activator NlpD
VDTPYGRRGPYWSCDRDAQGNGKHTGADFAAAAGTKVVAARPGSLVHCSHGSSFGNHQVEVRCDDGTRDFYAHMRSRTSEGDIQAGQKVGEVGSEGNATGPHLHFERHATLTGGWSCAVVRDPQPSIDYQPPEGEEMNQQDWDRMEKLIQSVWEDQMTVTQPGSGDDVKKSRQQVLRELWQKVTKAT